MVGRIETPNHPARGMAAGSTPLISLAYPYLPAGTSRETDLFANLADDRLSLSLSRLDPPPPAEWSPVARRIDTGLRRMMR